MELKPFIVGEDYPELCEWWRDHGWKAPGLRKLSTIGVVAFDDKWKYAAAWLFLQNSGWAVVEWFVVNPQAPLKGRSKAMKMIIDKLSELAKENGHDEVISFTREEGLQRFFKKLGFQVGDLRLTSMIRGLT